MYSDTVEKQYYVLKAYCLKHCLIKSPDVIESIKDLKLKQHLSKVIVFHWLLHRLHCMLRKSPLKLLRPE